MTNRDTNNNDRPLSEIVGELAQRQIETQTQVTETQMQLQDLISTTNQVLARNAILNDVILEIRESTEQHQRNFEEHQRNFEEHQRSANANGERLEAILMQLIQPRNGRAGNE